MDRGSHACPQNYVSVLMLTVKKISLIRVSFCQILLYTLYSVKKKMGTLSTIFNRTVQNVLVLLFSLSSPTHISVYTYFHVFFIFFKVHNGSQWYCVEYIVQIFLLISGL